MVYRLDDNELQSRNIKRNSSVTLKTVKVTTETNELLVFLHFISFNIVKCCRGDADVVVRLCGNIPGDVYH